MSALASRLLSALRGEQDVRRGTELNPHFAGAHRQIFSGAQIKRHAAPAPVVNEELDRDVGFDVGIRFHLGLLPVAGARLAVHDAGEILSAHDLFGDIGGRERADGFEQLHLFVADGFGFERHGRFHGDERKHLEHVVLRHVAQRAGLLVITAALADAERFADGDLDVVHGIPVPELLENRVGKAEHQNVRHRFLAEIMVNAADLAFVGVAGQLVVQRVRGGEVVAERLLDDDALPAGALLVQQRRRGGFPRRPGRTGSAAWRDKTAGFPATARCRTRSASLQVFCRLRRRRGRPGNKTGSRRIPSRPFHPRVSCGKTGRAPRAIPAATIRRSFRAAQSP